MWKVIYDAKDNKAIAFYMPNQAVQRSDLHTFAMSVKELEAVTGINFHPRLPAELKRVEEEKPNLSRWPGIK